MTEPQTPPPGGPAPLLQAFAEATRATDDDARRLLPRLRAPAPAPRRAPWAFGLALAAAAVAIGAWGLRPPADAPIAAAGLQAGRVALSDDVSLVVDGDGAVSGSTRAPRLAWERGTVDVEVTPGAGIDLQLETREAHIQVVGTRFQVRRDALGTRVEVQRGEVAVRCGDGPAEPLPAPQARTCWPLSPGGLLGRALALEADGAPAAERLATVEAGLAGAEGAVGRELEVMHIHLLVDAGRSAEARGPLLRVLDSGSPQRRDELLLLAEAMALAELPTGGCAPIDDLLQRLRAEGSLRAELAAACPAP